MKQIDSIIEDMGERQFARTWEKEEKNMRKILEKHLLPQEQEAKPQIARTSSDIERIMLEIDEAKEQVKRYLKTKTQ